MHFSAFEKARISGFYFFTFPYLFDALFLSRMPALKAQTGATETEIGWVLLTLGLCGLLRSPVRQPASAARGQPASLPLEHAGHVRRSRSGHPCHHSAGTRRLRRPFRVLPQCLGSSARTRTLFLWRCGIRSRPCPCCTLFTASGSSSAPQLAVLPRP